MSDIFISYSTADRDRIKPLVNALIQRGWSVWWDRTILAGKRWEDVIETALNEARCIIVVWSAASVQSEWVRAEADEGRRRRVLVPALLDDAKIPLAFRGIQAASLATWDGGVASPEFDDLARAVADVLGATAPQVAENRGIPQERAKTTPDGLAWRPAPANRRTIAIAGALVLLGLLGAAWDKMRGRPPNPKPSETASADSSARGDLLLSGLNTIIQKYSAYLNDLGFASAGPPPTISLTSKADLTAYYDPSTRRIVMDDALARWPFVGLREYTHHVLFTTRTDASSEHTGLESGLADYLPSSFSGQSDYGRETWELFRKRYPGEHIPDRNLENQRLFSEIVPGKTEEHQAGTVWGGAFWQLRRVIGKNDTDQLVAAAWKSFDLRQASSNVSTFARELLKQDAALNRGKFDRQIRDVFKDRGLALP